MQQVINTPECDFCHEIQLEFIFTNGNGLLVQCSECGYSRAARISDISSDSIILLAG